MTAGLPAGLPAVAPAVFLGTLVLGAGAAALTALMIVLLRPLLLRYALARPNARSLHQAPTPQGGGIAVLGVACLAALLGGLWPIGGTAPLGEPGLMRLGLVVVAALAMALVGLVDDLRPLPPLPRLVLQLLCVAGVVAALPDGTRVLPFVPLGAERILLVVGGAWFVNLVNFMDGMDWMSVVEMLPITAVLLLCWACGRLSAPAGLMALGLCGGLAGFAPFNRPVARLFLGDVGSLPIGLLAAFCLFDLAGREGGSGGPGGLAAAILLPLYYIADSGLTLVWRLKRGDRVWEAHRQHFYQVAVARGLSVRAVLARVLATNLALAGLAGLSLWADAWPAALLLLGLGAGIVAALLVNLRSGRPV
jgi:UDP-N-acetylmuramyl pentapeptide phosphotransferase/UDP-N-acetylglucosamine-1-phosphate transferase